MKNTYYNAPIPGTPVNNQSQISSQSDKLGEPGNTSNKFGIMENINNKALIQNDSNDISPLSADAIGNTSSASQHDPMNYISPSK